MVGQSEIRKYDGIKREIGVRFEYLYGGEIKDTGYGFVNNKGIEVCSDNDLEEVR